MKIFTVRIAAVDEIKGKRVGAVTLDGVFAYDAADAALYGEQIALLLYDWSGPGMTVVVFQTGEEMRR